MFIENNIYGPLLIICGAVLLIISVVISSRIFTLIESEVIRKKWMLLRRITGSFFTAYLFSAYILYQQDDFWLQIFVGGVFLTGAIYVYMVTSVSIRTLQVAKERETTFAHMVEEVSDYAIIMMTVDGDILSWNLGAEKIKGYKAEEIVNKNFKVFYSDEDIAAGKPDKLKEQAMQEGRAQDEGWRIRKDGSKFWGSVTITAIHDAKGNVAGFSKVTRDLTERKLAEDAREEHTQQLKAKNSELEQFVYIATHDLQEPLTTVTSLTNMLTDSYKGKLDETGEQTLVYISDTVSRMRNLIKGLLDYGRIGRNREKLIVNCNDLLRDVLSDLSTTIKNNEAVIKVEELPTVSAYETELRLLFQNLISNAIKFHQPDLAPVIKISAKEADGDWQFIIADNGIGMENKHIDRIFVLFQRLNERDEYGGTGIGLAHCKKIVELHGGKIWVDSAPNEGSTFYFTIRG